MSSDDWRRAAPRGTAGFLAVIGVVLIALAVPRLVSGITLAPHGETVARLGTLERLPMPPQPALYAAAESRRMALMAVKSGKSYAELGALQIAQARVAGFGSRAGGVLLDHAIGTLRASLALSPAQPYVWTQLALAVYAREPANENLPRLIRFATEMAPYEPRLVVRRADLGLAAWDRLDDPTRGLIAAQIRLAASHAPLALADAARRSGRFNTVRAVVDDNPALLRNFLSAYLRRS